MQLGSLLLELEILKDWFHQQFIASLENEGGLGKEAFLREYVCNNGISCYSPRRIVLRLHHAKIPLC